MAAEGSFRRRLGWFVLLWLVSAGGVAGFAYAFRAVLGL